MPQRRKILIIEDQADHWKIVQIAIEKSMPHTDAVWASNKEHTLDYLLTLTEQQFPDLILLDLYLPHREDGWHLLELLKQSQRYRLIPIVIFSHSNVAEDILGSYNLGCSSYLIKSVNILEWNNYFSSLYNYWWLTATLPPS